MKLQPHNIMKLQCFYAIGEFVPYGIKTLRGRRIAVHTC